MREARRFRRPILAGLLAAALALTGCGGSPPHPVRLDNPLFETKLLSGQAIHAKTAELELRSAGRTAEADEIARLSAQPTATWLNGDPEGQFDHLLAANILAAAKPDEAPIFVLYNLPNRDIGHQYSRGGAKNAHAYKTWVNSIAAELGDRKAIIIVEPDGVAAMARGQLHDEAAREQRYELIIYALRTLADNPHSRVYLDAGNPGWTKPEEMSGLLERAGVDLADGIAVNVSNFYTDAESAAYGQRLSELLGGVGVVVDRSRNGNGAEQPQGPLSFCNPPGRAIGLPPAVGGKQDVINAWLWIKPPGDSDGSCRPGEPPAGQFWLDYALGLVRGK